MIGITGIFAGKGPVSRGATPLETGNGGCIAGRIFDPQAGGFAAGIAAHLGGRGPSPASRCCCPLAPASIIRSAAITIRRPDPEAAQQAPGNSIGTGQVKVALILPLSAQGNAGQVGVSMRNAAELAISEFNNPDLQLLVKDDAGSPQGAQAAAQQALDEGAQIVLGPLFAQSVQAVGQIARSRNLPVIAFSTDANAASRGVYLLSFLPETDVDRIVDYAISQNKRSFVALGAGQSLRQRGRGGVSSIRRTQGRPRDGAGALPDRSFAHAGRGAEYRAVGRQRGRAVPAGRWRSGVGGGAGAGGRRRQSQAAATARHRLVGRPAHLQFSVTGRRLVCRARSEQPDNFRAFARRYAAKYGQEPARTATLSYDAVALVAALVKTQGPRGLTNEVLTNPSGFAGIDGVFRFSRRGHQPARSRRAEGSRRRADRWFLRRRRRSGTKSRRHCGRFLYPSPKRGGIKKENSAFRAQHATPRDRPTTASKIGKPSRVTRRRPSEVFSTKPSLASEAMRASSSERPESAV